MKKLISLILVAVMAFCVVACNSTDASDPGTATVKVPGMREITASFTSSTTDARGTTLKTFTNDAGDELVLTADGKLRGATFAENSLSGVSADAKKVSEDEIRDIAAKFVAELTGKKGEYAEAAFAAHAAGYSITFNQKVAGYFTENYVYMSFNSAGGLYTFAALTDVDYSGFDASLVKDLDEAKLLDHAKAGLTEKNAENVSITGTYLYFRDGKYSLALFTEYKDSEGVQTETVMYNLD